MSLEKWVENGWLRRHTTSAEEIQGLLAIVGRDLEDADGDISSDWRFGIAYNSALKLCTILLYASGYRAERNRAHHRTIQSLPLILGTDRQDDADYLDECRRKRNIVEYEYAGATTERDAEELIAFTRKLREEVIEWLGSNRADIA
jgi:hypothetical protein